MRLRPKKNREVRLEKVSHLFAVLDENGGIDIEKTFGDWGCAPDSPLFAEIGCGKGAFSSGLSERNPDARIIAVELVPDVLMMAMERAERDGRKNIAFYGGNADRADAFLPAKSLDRLYLNFSDPWPRKKHEKRRLTSPLFLERYKKVLKDGARLYFKTDNNGLFAYTLETLERLGIQTENVCFDLHADKLSEGNIMTEYESAFSSAGVAIKYLEAIF